MAADISGAAPEDPDVEISADGSPSASDIVASETGHPAQPSPSRQPPVNDQDVHLPAFLRQTKAEIQEKFQDLEWLQRSRLLQSQQNPDPTSRWAQEQDYEVKARNRYFNVQAWANNRIHLKVPSDQCDYINASPIVLESPKTHHERRYIASQGPRADQLGHFWRMVWHETDDPAVIVMLTQTWEAGRDKCFQYFPESLEDDTITVDDEDEFGDGFKATVKLVHIEENISARSTVRQLSLTVNDASKTIWHFQFVGWPDFSIPEAEDRTALLELIRLSEDTNTAPGSPRIVHCSAGVGRSGTFIALDYLLALLDEGLIEDLGDESEADIVFDTVNTLREQRMTMVQSDSQLSFIYEVVKEKWLARKTSARAEDDAAGQNGSVPAQQEAEDKSFSEPTMMSDRGPQNLDPEPA